MSLEQYTLVFQSNEVAVRVANSSKVNMAITLVPDHVNYVIYINCIRTTPFLLSCNSTKYDLNCKMEHKAPVAKVQTIASDTWHLDCSICTDLQESSRRIQCRLAKLHRCHKLITVPGTFFGVLMLFVCLFLPKSDAETIRLSSEGLSRAAAIQPSFDPILYQHE